MEPPGSTESPPPSTPNPVVAIGRKVKAVLSTQQRPSVRILRQRISSSKELSAKSGSHQPPAERQELGSQPERAEFTPSPPKESNSSNRFWPLFGRRRTSNEDEFLEREYDSDTVDLLDVVDPEVATLSTLTNVQNSLFVPQLGRIINRRPAYRISDQPGEERIINKIKASLKRVANPAEHGDGLDEPEGGGLQRTLLLGRKSTTKSTLKNAQYAILPNDKTLQGWTHEDEEELDDLVRHMLHSRRARFKRSMKGFSQYVRRPLGLFVTVYATLVTLFGAAWVFFLIGWISLGSKQDYVVNVVDNVLVALFAIIGDGLAPFRAVDTYHMIYIAHYHRKTWKKREKLGLPELVDRNDLPEKKKDDVGPNQVDLESLVARRVPASLARRIAPRIPKKIARKILIRGGTKDPIYEYSVLTEEEQAKLEYHERKFSKSHTFYKPHETETHFAFPLKILVAVVILLDFHSALQITLGACTWGIDYKTRPFALTTVILCFSITCNILGGVLISRGDKKTRKTDVIERMLHQELTSEAIDQIETRWMKEAEERGEIDKTVRKKLEEEREEAENEEIKKQWKVVPSLPKILLGKGEDHRQPSLPQEARRSSASISSTAASSSRIKNSKPGSSAALPPVVEGSAYPSRPKPVAKRDKEPPGEGTGQKILRLVRRADMDKT